MDESVVFHGYANPASTPEYYKSVDFCVFPSRRDSFDITMMEAMASGTPVIASNRGGTAEILTNGENALLFDPDDLDALRHGILAYSHDSSLRRKFSRNALKTVKNYSWENISKRYLALYQEIIQKKR